MPSAEGSSSPSQPVLRQDGRLGGRTGRDVMKGRLCDARDVNERDLSVRGRRVKMQPARRPSLVLALPGSADTSRTRDTTPNAVTRWSLSGEKIAHAEPTVVTARLVPLGTAI